MLLGAAFLAGPVVIALLGAWSSFLGCLGLSLSLSLGLGLDWLASLQAFNIIE